MEQQQDKDISSTAHQALRVAERQLRHPGEARKVVRQINQAGAGATRALDSEVDKFIAENLVSRGFGVLSEESGLNIPPGSRYFAIVDPIDGTDVALRGLDFYAVSIAAGELEDGTVYLRNVEYAVVASPRGTYSARKGAGAYFNGKRIHTSTVGAVGKGILRIPQKRTTVSIVKRAGTFVYLGCSSLEICMVAHGLIDAYYESKQRKVYDYAAAMLIASEAGAVVTSVEGRPLSTRALGRLSRSTLLIAANERLWGDITRAR